MSVAQEGPARLSWTRPWGATGLWCASWAHDERATVQAWVRRVRTNLYLYGASRPPEPGWPPAVLVGRAASLDEALTRAADFLLGL